jgi:Bacterial regulatory helix-turn-helix protein, lysR family
MLTTRQMLYFEALAEAGHFGRAADRVHVSQPALSAQIAEMERELGFTLLSGGLAARSSRPAEQKCCSGLLAFWPSCE